MDGVRVAVDGALGPQLFLPHDGLMVGLVNVPHVPLAMLTQAAWKEPAWRRL